MMKETLFTANTSVMKQHGCEAALGPGPSSAKEFSSGLVWTALLRGDIFSVPAQAQIQSFEEKQKRTLQPQGSWLIWREVPTLVPD